ncbi:MAG: S49 family peptidase, partial [Clostridiales bacterium]
SGAYWAACSADKVILNRYCLTGSIGVTYGTLLDFSGLLEKYGVKATHIDSGKNKGMGDMLVGMTAEQVAILQTLIDEYYQYFLKSYLFLE